MMRRVPHSNGKNGVSSLRKSAGSLKRPAGGISFVKALVLATVAFAVTLFTVSLKMYHFSRAQKKQEVLRPTKTSTAGMLNSFHQKGALDVKPERRQRQASQQTVAGETKNMLDQIPQPVSPEPPGTTFSADKSGGSGSGFVVKRHRTKKEATEAMLRQPSTWVDGERKLREKLLPLLEQQKTLKKNLGLAVTTRWLGDNVPPFAINKGEEKGWKKVVEPLMEEVSRKAKEQDEQRRARDALRPKKIHLTERRKQLLKMEGGESPLSTEGKTPASSESISSAAADNDMVSYSSGVKSPRTLTSKQSSEYPRPFDASEYSGHKVVRLQPAFGRHRPKVNAIFAFAEGYDLHTYIGFIESLKREAPSFDGDIVLSVSSLTKLKRGVEAYLKSHSNVVVYTVDWTCFEPATMKQTDAGPKEGQNICQVDGLYGSTETSIAEQLGAESTPLADPREARPVATARYELYWSWATQYSPQSWIMLIDSRDTHFQRNPFEGLAPLKEEEESAGTLYLFEENSDAVPIGKSPFNRKWLETAYTSQVVAPFFDQPVVCSGSTMGQQPAIEAYLRAMVAQYDDTKCKMKGCDQGFHNYLLYSGTLEKLHGISDIVIFPQGTGIINNLGLLRDKPLRERGILSENEDQVLNWDLTVSRVAHQVDRDDELNRIIKRRKSQYQAMWSESQSARRNGGGAVE